MIQNFEQPNSKLITYRKVPLLCHVSATEMLLIKKQMLLQSIKHTIFVLFMNSRWKSIFAKQILLASFGLFSLLVCGFRRILHL